MSSVRSNVQGVAQVAADFAERHFVELARDVLQLLLQLLDAARRGGDLQRIGARIERCGLGMGEHIEADVELAGDEVAGAQLRAQAALYQAPPHLAAAQVLALLDFAQAAQGVAEAFRKDFGDDFGVELVARRVEVQGD